MAAARRAGLPIVTGKFSVAEPEIDAGEISDCAGGCGDGADMGSDSVGEGARLGSVPVASAGRDALGCGAGADAGAAVDAGAGIGADPAAGGLVVGIGGESGATVIEAGAGDGAWGGAGCGDGGPSRFGATGAAVAESCGLFNDASAALSDGAAGAGIDVCPFEGATAFELVSGCAEVGNGCSVTAGASIATRSS
jgi:hypothetical protein